MPTDAQLLAQLPVLLWRGDDLAVVYKPPQWICDATDVSPNPWRSHTDIAAARAPAGTSTQKKMHWWLQLAFPKHDIFGNTADGHGLCHRLDRETSGGLLVAFTSEAHRRMREHFRRHRVHKAYVCLAQGAVKGGTSMTPLYRDSNASHQTRPHPYLGQRATTDVRPLASLRYRERLFTLCRCEIYEGRTHQIRAHMTFDFGASIVADDLYPNKLKTDKVHVDHVFCNRLFLHAYALAFPYGDDGAYVSVVCPLPLDLQTALRHLRLDSEAPTAHIVWPLLKERGFLQPEDETVVVKSESALRQLGFYDWKLQRRLPPPPPPLTRAPEWPPLTHALEPTMLRSKSAAYVAEAAQPSQTARGSDRPRTPPVSRKDPQRVRTPPRKKLRAAA